MNFYFLYHTNNLESYYSLNTLEDYQHKTIIPKITPYQLAEDIERLQGLVKEMNESEIKKYRDSSSHFQFIKTKNGWICNRCLKETTKQFASGLCEDCSHEFNETRRNDRTP